MLIYPLPNGVKTTWAQKCLSVIMACFQYLIHNRWLSNICCWWRNGSVYKNLLFLQKLWVHFPALKSGESQCLITLVIGVSDTLFCLPTQDFHPLIHAHIETHINKNRNQFFFKKINIGWENRWSQNKFLLIKTSKTTKTADSGDLNLW